MKQVKSILLLALIISITNPALSISLEDVLLKTVEDNLSLRQQLIKLDIKRLELQYSKTQFDFEHSFELRKTKVNLTNSFDRSQSNDLEFSDFKSSSLKRFNFGLTSVLDFNLSEKEETTFDFSLPPGANPLNIAAILENGLRFQKNDVRSSTLRLTFIQPLLRGRGKDVGNIANKLAQIDEKEELIRTKKLTDELLFQITSKYIELKQRFDEMKINELSQKVSKETLNLSIRKYEAGDINKLDLLIARQNYRQSKNSYLNAESSFETAWSELLEISEADLKFDSVISKAEVKDFKKNDQFDGNYDKKIIQAMKDKFKALLARDKNLSSHKLDLGISAGTISTSAEKNWSEIIVDLKKLNEYEISTWIEYKIPLDRNQKLKSKKQNSKNLKLVSLEERNIARKLKELSSRIEKQIQLLEKQLENTEVQVAINKQIESEIRNQFQNGLALVKDLSEAELNSKRVLLLRSSLNYRTDLMKLSLAKLYGKTFSALGIEFDILKKARE